MPLRGVRWPKVNCEIGSSTCGGMESAISDEARFSYMKSYYPPSTRIKLMLRCVRTDASGPFSSTGPESSGVAEALALQNLNLDCWNVRTLRKKYGERTITMRTLQQCWLYIIGLSKVRLPDRVLSVPPSRTDFISAIAVKRTPLLNRNPQALISSC